MLETNENILEEFAINELEDRVEFSGCTGGGSGGGNCGIEINVPCDVK